jgi:AmiR/NasT family two-component response regulator
MGSWPVNLGQQSKSRHPGRNKSSGPVGIPAFPSYPEYWPVRFKPRDAMSSQTHASLRVLLAGAEDNRQDRIAATIARLGHAAVGRGVPLESIGAVTRSERPDVALVMVGESSKQALRLIDGVVRQAACPVIAILPAQDRQFVKEAARRGIFAYIVDGIAPDELQSEIDIVLSRFAEYHNLEGAFSRRAVTERAKGILMERHELDEEAAFNLLREHARRTQQKIVEVAEALLLSHR